MCYLGTTDLLEASEHFVAGLRANPVTEKGHAVINAAMKAWKDPATQHTGTVLN